MKPSRNILALSAFFILTLVAFPADEKKVEQHNVPPKGFTALFNGKDLTGWQSVITMKERKTLTKDQIEKKLEADNAKHLVHWKVKNGVIEYDGKADSLQTVKDYGDFELHCDWKIAEQGDSGIYLRGQPQVQIWDSDKTPGVVARMSVRAPAACGTTRRTRASVR